MFYEVRNRATLMKVKQAEVFILSQLKMELMLREYRRKTLRQVKQCLKEEKWLYDGWFSCTERLLFRHPNETHSIEIVTDSISIWIYESKGTELFKFHIEPYDDDTLVIEPKSITNVKELSKAVREKIRSLTPKEPKEGVIPNLSEA